MLWFFVLSYAISWAWVIPWAATGHTVEQGVGWPTQLPSLVGPMLAAFVLTASTEGRAGVGDLVRRMVRWQIGWRWWVAAVSPLLFFLVVLAVMAVAGLDVPARDDVASFSGIPLGLGLIGVWTVVFLVNGFGEETGWRGYALPQLQRRFGPLTATLILAAAWAGWHVPQFFYLRSYKDFPPAMVPVFVFGLLAGAVVLTWLYNGTGGSILAVAVWHALYNLTGATRAAGSGALSAVMWTFVVVTALALLVLEWRASRAGGRSVLGPRPARRRAADPAASTVRGG
ncbi:CPBP family intramembrane glutamic endopeptidase [Intrasporangium oryzae]|uniref:CPBP family intramembrane glutamic endopeptidase n=1 Tax=Intrasporangium oryzae TaxID=412687 RepID=UPI0004B43473|nr:CPBP family intramembrane glutamic endopeptidase [Intrasporangium oryzae]